MEEPSAGPAATCTFCFQDKRAPQMLLCSCCECRESPHEHRGPTQAARPAIEPGHCTRQDQLQQAKPATAPCCAADTAPLPPCPAWGGQDTHPSPAQHSPGKAHPAPQRQCCVLERVNLHSGCSPEPRGCHPGGKAHEAHEAHAVPQPCWQQHFHPHAVPEERSGPVPRCSSPQHCSGCIGLLQARGIYTEPAWMVPINGRLYLAKAGFSFPEERKSVKRPEEGGQRQAQRWGASEEGPGCVSTGGEHSLCPAPPAPAGLSHTTA